MTGFFPNCISSIVWSYIDGIIQACMGFETYAITGQETFTNSSFTLVNIHRCTGPSQWHQAPVNSLPPFYLFNNQEQGPLFFSHSLSPKQNTTKFWPFLHQSFLPPTNNRQETSVALPQRGRRSKGASKKFGELWKRPVLREAESEGSERTNTGRWQPEHTPGCFAVPFTSVWYCTHTERESCEICQILWSFHLWNISHSFSFLWGLLKLPGKPENTSRS